MELMSQQSSNETNIMPGNPQQSTAPDHQANQSTSANYQPSEIYRDMWRSSYASYPISNQSPASPSLSNNSLSPISQFRSPKAAFHNFPESPQLVDSSMAMMMAPEQMRKRREASAMLRGIDNHPVIGDSIPPMQFLRRISVPKIPVSPQGRFANASAKAKPRNLILPCFFDQQNNLRVHGPHFFDKAMAGGYWDESRQTIQSFLDEAASIDEENITIIEVKQLLRRYSINATGKKTILIDRIKRLQAYLSTELERQQEALRQQAAQSLVSASPRMNGNVAQ